MKIISILPVKNETWILRFSLKNFSLFSDEILILDDGSEDNLPALVKDFPKVTVIPFSVQEEYVDMSLRRNTLLREARERRGTHFVCLDADETFSSTFIIKAQQVLKKMQPGETLMLPWIILNRDTSDTDQIYFDKKDYTNYKDFIFCDDGKSVYEKKFLSEARTPGNDTQKILITFDEGYVLHFIYIAGKRTQLKQAWYRASELVEGTRSARKINATYAITKNPVYKNKELLNDSFTQENFNLIEESAGYSFYINSLKKIFSQKGIAFFEDLDIWHIKELEDLFVEELGRKPVPKLFHPFLLAINATKNKIKNAILLKYSLNKKDSK